MKPSTAKDYDRDWLQQFCPWCALNGIDPVWCSVDELTRCFREWFADGSEYSTIGRRKAAIGTYQRRFGNPHPAATDYAMRAVMQELRRRAAPRRRALPISHAVLVRLYRQCEEDGSLIGLRDRAAIALSWLCCLKRSEVAALRIYHLSNGRLPAGMLAEAFGWTLEWVKAAGIGDVGAGFLFRGFGGGRISPSLQPNSLARMLKRRCAALGLSPKMFSWESIRTGRVAYETARGTGLRQTMEIARLRSAGSVLVKMGRG